MGQDEYFKERLDDQIDWYGRKSVSSQRWFKLLQLIVIIFSLAIPLLSGYMDETTTYLKIIIGLLGFSIAAVTAVLGLYQFQERWLEYRTTCEMLKHEKYLYLTRASPYNGEEPFLLLVGRVEGLVLKENTKWKNYMKKSKSDKKMANKSN